jgi:hypothetical protein
MRQVIEKAVLDQCFGGITCGGFADGDDVRTMVNFEQFCKAVAWNAAQEAARKIVTTPPQPFKLRES